MGMTYTSVSVRRVSMEERAKITSEATRVNVEEVRCYGICKNLQLRVQFQDVKVNCPAVHQHHNHIIYGNISIRSIHKTTVAEEDDLRYL